MRVKPQTRLAPRDGRPRIASRTRPGQSTRSSAIDGRRRRPEWAERQPERRPGLPRPPSRRSHAARRRPRRVARRSVPWPHGVHRASLLRVRDGRTLDAALVAAIIAAGWDQCAFNEAMSPAAIAFEDVILAQRAPRASCPGLRRLHDGGQGANTVGLAAGRWHVPHEAAGTSAGTGWALRIRAGRAERHATIDRTVRLLGIGESSIVVVFVLPDGAMDTSAPPAALEGRGPMIVCAQAGNVNTGACDDLTAAAKAARAAGAWLHVDGAFGLWAAASPRASARAGCRARRFVGPATGMKWLNVPYDCGYVRSRADVHATAPGIHRGLSHRPGCRTRVRRRRSRGRVFAPCSWLRNVGGAPFARPLRSRGTRVIGAATSPSGSRRSWAARRGRDRERRRLEPGARPASETRS